MGWKYDHLLPMMMCKADVTGSFTPTVAKHTQSVEPGYRIEHSATWQHQSDENPFLNMAMVVY